MIYFVVGLLAVFSIVKIISFIMITKNIKPTKEDIAAAKKRLAEEELAKKKRPDDDDFDF
ncbi:hypothetical protein [Streptococcus pacificus]|uniref:DUF3042 family protein n=1 Tax=Streptococcus pacificus TaxID=2740577 RepID=A0ABS0ZH90_9STRE|nr:hypothetical protein [Streptococcus pacificus]MBJ8325359.1 hypothetical protein [Streptococcus pacificus]